MNENYNNKMKEIISHLEYVPKLLLHSCCGPCSTTCINILSNYFYVDVLYYNPNIEPEDEYIKRKNEQIKFINEFNGKYPVKFIDADYDNEDFMKDLHPLKEEKEGGKRCAVCIKKRMEYTCLKAKELGYDYFATTLTVSPHKNSQVINKIGESLEELYGIKFLYSDFKKEDGYLKSINYAKEYNLYRQNYCGCRCSKYDDIDGD